MDAKQEEYNKLTGLVVDKKASNRSRHELDKAKLFKRSQVKVDVDVYEALLDRADLTRDLEREKRVSEERELSAKCKEQKADEKLKDAEQQEQALAQREMALTAREKGIDMEVADRVGKTENSLLQELIDHVKSYRGGAQVLEAFINKVREREESHKQEDDEELDDEEISR